MGQIRHCAIFSDDPAKLAEFYARRRHHGRASLCRGGCPWPRRQPLRHVDGQATDGRRETQASDLGV